MNEDLSFEYDTNKSKSNKTKHGIDFEEAKELFCDKNLIQYPANYVDESREFVTGLINGNFYTSIVTQRGKKIRLISVRRARKKEIELYKRNKNGENYNS